MKKQEIEQARSYIQDADAILITAGAGMGVDSGLPDFRGNKGFWKAYPPLERLGLDFQEMANPKWFDTNPKLAWAFYGHRLNLYRDTTPHKGFDMLLELCKKKDNDYFIFTSNVDNQFQKAGFDPKKIVEIHGSIEHWQCGKNCKRDIWDAEKKRVAIDMEKFEALELFVCPHCGEIARPNILMFNDWQWNEKRTNSQIKRIEAWLESIQNKKLVIVEIGAGVEIPTVRLYSQKIAKNIKNAKLIRINPKDFDIDNHLGWSIPFGGLRGLELLKV